MRIVLIFFFLISTLYSQDISNLGSLSDLKTKVTQKTTFQLPEAPELEHPVNPDNYILGPGDVLSIIIGEEEDIQQVMVSPEGTIVVVSIGDIEVAGLTLVQAKRKIVDRLSAKYLSKLVTITLVQLRTFRVTVSGSVNFPGLVTVNALNRVSDAIFLAGGLIEPPSKLPEPEDPRIVTRGSLKPKLDPIMEESEFEEIVEKKASKRNIVVKRRDDTFLHTDLLKYELAGHLDSNPYLLDGDVIIVPSEPKQVGKVSIFGAVRTPNTFEYVTGDKIKDILDMAHGFSIDADSNKINIVRFENNTSKPFNIVKEIDWSDEESKNLVLNTFLMPDDRIFVRSIPKYHKTQTVEVEGEVKYPGKYALLQSPTKLSTIIEIAGGFTEDAALSAAYVIRRSHEDYKDAEFERLNHMLVTEMENREKAYYRARLRELKGHVATNFIALFEQGNEDWDVALYNDDLIVIPAKETTVQLLGHVKNPGLLKWEYDKDLDYYINKAGGYNVGAWKNKIRIKKAVTGELVKAKSTTIEMGDIIFVPEKIERDKWEIFRDITIVTAQLATVALLIVQTNYYTGNK